MTTSTAQRDHRVAVIAGDGVGPELIRQALRLLDAVSTQDGVRVHVDELPDSGDYYLQTGTLMDDATWEVVRASDSVLLGAVGHPDLPSGFVEARVLHALVDELDLSIGLRKAMLYADHLTPLKDIHRGDIDILLVRATREGEITIPGGHLGTDTPYEAAVNVVVHTRHGVEATLRYAFEAARLRRGRLAVVAQYNAMAAHSVWERAYHQIAPEYQDVAAELLLPDNAAMQLVLDPKRFDVIASTVIIGGILCDLMGGLIGGIGLIGSARWNPNTNFGVYEPAHGSAPKYAGMDRVSPIATFRALAMLLENLGEGRSAARIDSAIDAVFRDGMVRSASTRDAMGTVAVTDAVLAIIEAAE